MARKVSAFVTFDLDRRRPRALFMIQLSAADPPDIAVLKRWRLVHRGKFLNGGVIVLFVEQDDALVSNDKVVGRNFAALFGARFQIGEFDFEDGAPRHL